MSKQITKLKRLNKHKLKNRLDKKPKVKKKQNDYYAVAQQDNRGVVGTDEMVDGVAHPGDTVFGNF